MLNFVIFENHMLKIYIKINFCQRYSNAIVQELSNGYEIRLIKNKNNWNSLRRIMTIIINKIHDI